MGRLRLPVAVPVIAAVLVLLVAAVTIVAVRGRAARADSARNAVAALQLAATGLNGLEWQAIADRAVDPEVADTAQSMLARMDRSLVRLERLGVGKTTPRLRAKERGYERAVGDEFQALRQGRVVEARRIDRTRTDPAFAALRVELQRADSHLSANVRRSRSISDGGSVAAVVVGLLALLLPFRRLAKDRRRSAEEAVQAASNRKLRSLVEHGSDVVAIVDADGMVMYAGGPSARVLGVDAAALVGRRLFGDFPAESEREAEGLLASSRVADRTPVAGEVGTAAGGALAVVATDRLDDPSVGGIVVNLRDVSATRLLEEELRRAQRLDAVGKLAGGIAHDFNNLLTAIRGYCDLLRPDIQSDTGAQRKVQGIVHASERAGELTRQLLAFSSRQMLQPKVIDLNHVALDMESMLRRLIPSDIELVLDCDPRITSVLADPSQLEQVILNLVVNARDAMRSGGSVTISTHDYVVDPDQSAEHPMLPGAYVELVVTDTGIGMDEHTRAHAFEPFFTTKKLEGGTGLGLATVYGIVKQSGGHVTIESQLGAGATIRVLLPSAGSERPEPALPAVETAPQRGDELILLVDDDAMVRATSASLLENLGYTLLTATDGAEGLRLAEQHADEIAVVITDIVMPRMGGVELAERLRARNPNAKIIFISGYSEEAALGRGALTDDRLLQKPFSAAELGAAVRAVLDGGPISIE